MCLTDTITEASQNGDIKKRFQGGDVLCDSRRKLRMSLNEILHSRIVVFLGGNFAIREVLYPSGFFHNEKNWVLDVEVLLTINLRQRGRER